MEKKVFYSDSLESLEMVWRLRSLKGWDVYDEIKPKFDWKRLRTRFRMILCKKGNNEKYN